MFFIKKLKSFFDRREKFYLQAPNVVKEQEKNRLNPCLTNIKDLGTLFPEVSYLWIINQKGDIYIGIEKPWHYPRAFGFENEDEEWKKIRKNLLFHKNSIGGFGHPTLSPIYDEKGIIVTDTEKLCCYIGGEINYKQGKWVVDHASGRFGIINLDENKIQNALNLVSRSIKGLSPERVDVKVMKKYYTYLESYYKQWDKGRDNLESSIKLLEDYVTGNSIGSYLKLKFFRNGKEDVVLATELIQKAKQGTIETVEELLDYFRERKNINDFDSGLQRRLKFISGQCGLESLKYSDNLDFFKNN